ncbi:hypothetical protein [Campylobacter gastrosuis]|uniref:Uncharacterized protein n=1 Tax=Campylobacter gastrosuis TaxID=2974576 RepID=A0ABT7HMG7_9BACT|nr:hypothetical protein [Campylobacter gastrosuis]MDL0088125.1 hypothetical protein [Campylobacter gastrosuis]
MSQKNNSQTSTTWDSNGNMQTNVRTPNGYITNDSNGISSQTFTNGNSQTTYNSDGSLPLCILQNR